MCFKLVCYLKDLDFCSCEIEGGRYNIFAFCSCKVGLSRLKGDTCLVKLLQSVESVVALVHCVVVRN